MAAALSQEKMREDDRAESRADERAERREDVRGTSGRYASCEVSGLRTASANPVLGWPPYVTPWVGPKA